MVPIASNKPRITVQVNSSDKTGKLLFKKETSVIINTKVTKSTKDLDLLNKALSEKIETETRKTIIEKAPK